MVEITNLDIEGVKLITLTRHSDDRGWLNEVWRDSWSEKIGTTIDFVQDMVTYNKSMFTLRGLHTLNVNQYKLVSVYRGAIFDVIADARLTSKTYGKYIPLHISEYSKSSVLIPPGCYHGYMTLTADSIIGYKVDAYHSNELDIGINWKDPTFNITWPTTENITISDKDKNLPFL